MEDYNTFLETKAKEGFEIFIDIIRDDRNLIYNVDEIDDETEVEVEILDDNEGTDIIGTYYFDENGKFVRSI